MLFIKELQQNYEKPHLSESELDALDNTLLCACVQANEAQILRTKARLTQLRQSKKRSWHSFLLSTRPLVLGRFAIGMVLFLASVWWFQQPNIQQAEYLILTQAYLTEPVPHTTQKKGSNTELEAKNAYQNRDFTTAAQLFKTVIDSNQANITCYYYGAMAHLFRENPDYQLVIHYLLHVKNQGGGYEMDKTLWYLSLAYVQSRQLTDAKNMLKILITRGNFNTEKAQILLKSIP